MRIACLLCAVVALALGAVGCGGDKAHGARHVEAAFDATNVSRINYFMDPRTGVCFARVTVLDGYGNGTVGVAQVTCSKEVVNLVVAGLGCDTKATRGGDR